MDDEPKVHLGRIVVRIGGQTFDLETGQASCLMYGLKAALAQQSRIEDLLHREMCREIEESVKRDDAERLAESSK